LRASTASLRRTPLCVRSMSVDCLLELKIASESWIWGDLALRRLGFHHSCHTSRSPSPAPHSRRPALRLPCPALGRKAAGMEEQTVAPGKLGAALACGVQRFSLGKLRWARQVQRTDCRMLQSGLRALALDSEGLDSWTVLPPYGTHIYRTGGETPCLHGSR